MSNHIKMVIFLSLALLTLLGWHFGTVLGLFGSPPQSRIEFFIRLGVFVACFIVLSIIISSLIAVKAGEDAVMPDEREEIIELKAERNGGVVVMLCLLTLMWFVFNPISPMAIANIILAILCLGEIVKLGSGLLYLRRGV